MIRTSKFDDDATRLIYWKGGFRYECLRAFHIVSNDAKLIWEAITSTFLDKSGNPFYDKSGIPFQGRKND